MTGTEHSKTQLYQRDFVTTVSINSINTMKHIHIELHCDQLCCSEQKGAPFMQVKLTTISYIWDFLKIVLLKFTVIKSLNIPKGRVEGEPSWS